MAESDQQKTTEQIISEAYDAEAETAAVQASTPESPETPAVVDDGPPRTSKGQFGYQHPPRVLKMAQDLGLSEEEILTSPTAELRDLIKDAALERQVASFSERRDQIQQQTAAAVQQQPQQSAKPAEQPAAPVEAKLDGEDDIAPHIVAHLKALMDRLSRIEQHIQGQAQQTFEQKADRTFNDLGPNFEPFLGKGGAKELGKDSTEILLRKAVLADAVKLAGANASAEDVLSKIPQAASDRFKKQLTPATPEAPKSKAQLQREQLLQRRQQASAKVQPNGEDFSVEAYRRWVAGGLARPSHIDGSDELPAGTQRAVLAVENYLAQNGTSSESIDADLDDFPG